MSISSLNLGIMNAATVSKLFAPMPADETYSTNAGTVMPSVSSGSSSGSIVSTANNVTSRAIAAIQALVAGGTSSPSKSSAALAEESQSLPDWYTATGTTTFTPEGATKPITMPTDEYLWYKDTGMPQTLDEIKTQYYQTFSVSNVTRMLNDAEATGNQTNISYLNSLLNAVRTDSLRFEPIDPSVVGNPWQYSVVRDSAGHVNGMSGMSSPDFQESFDKVYTDNSRWYGTTFSPLSATFVVSWSKT